MTAQNTPQASVSAIVGDAALPRTRRGQASYRRRLRFQAEVLLINNTIAEIQNGNFTDISVLGDLGIAAHSGPGNELTPHERFLDGWRVWITAGMLAALFAVVGLILFTKTAAAAATPYVSVLSGLAGIALGWMFASAGSPSGGGKGRSGATLGGASSAPSAMTSPGSAAPASPAPAATARRR
jgi:hypothetical protein